MTKLFLLRALSWANFFTFCAFLLILNSFVCRTFLSWDECDKRVALWLLHEARAQTVFVKHLFHVHPRQPCCSVPNINSFMCFNYFCASCFFLVEPILRWGKCLSYARKQIMSWFFFFYLSFPSFLTNDSGVRMNCLSCCKCRASVKFVLQPAYQSDRFRALHNFWILVIMI